ncbi:Ig-like domain-containing protein [Clostridium estertheticum]|uniref:Ig-like domain-containing protein n=1 Tax=Clostridium estertheticum TaxID=238834 RepID=UPI001C0B064B|nr:Ig-like domain-containing protein [Clostridium estertheticum]MBU3179081.1 Ig-like domain-containing protein [Clostridium estertheticum]
MNRKIISTAIAALMVAGSTSFTAFAAMSSGTVVIGTKAFDLAYANNLTNITEINSAIVEGGAIYVKDFNGAWIDNLTGAVVSSNVIPAVVYKSSTKTINYNVADKDAVAGEALSISSVSAIADKNVDYATTKSNVGLPAAVILNLSDGTTKSVAVTWANATYDGTKTASYAFTGAYVLPVGVTGTMPIVTANVIVGATTEKATDIGKTVKIVDNSYGTYEVTINSVELDSYRNQFDESNPAEVYKVTYTYKLLSKGSSTYMGLYVGNFSSVDSTGEVGNSYPGDTKNYPQELNIVGSRCTAETFIAVKNKTTSLTLTLDYSTPDGSSYVTFNMPTN